MTDAEYKAMDADYKKRTGLNIAEAENLIFKNLEDLLNDQYGIQGTLEDPKVQKV